MVGEFFAIIKSIILTSFKTNMFSNQTAIFEKYSYSSILRPTTVEEIKNHIITKFQEIAALQLLQTKIV